MTKIIVEGTWRCPSCGSINRGREQKCECGYTRDEDTVFSFEETVVEADEKGKAEARKGPDWWCEHCRGYVDADLEKCPDCGAEHSGITYHDIKKKRKKAKGEYKPPRPETIQISRSQVAARSRSSIRLTPFGVIALVGLVCVIVGGLWFFFKTSPTVLTLSEVEWVRTIDVEIYKTIREEGWLDEAPNDAIVQGRESRQRSLRKVPDGTERVQETVGYEDVPNSNCGQRDLGNGFREVELCTRPIKEWRDRPKFRSEPVMDTYAWWTVKRWQFWKTLSVHGSDLKPYDPEFVREINIRLKTGSETASYTAKFLDTGGGVIERTIPFGRWKNLVIGKHYPAKINAFGFVLSIDIS